jgi:hypothetical protein
MDREAQDWFRQSDIGPGFGLTLNSEAKKFFHEAHEKFTSSSGTGSDLFSKFMKENEERFLLHCSARASVGGFEQDGHDFIRSFSASSGWTMPPLRNDEKLQSPFSQTTCPSKLSSVDKTLFGGGFPMFVVSNRRMWAESWSENFSLSQSSFKYRTNVCR